MGRVMPIACNISIYYIHTYPKVRKYKMGFFGKINIHIRRMHYALFLQKEIYKGSQSSIKFKRKAKKKLRSIGSILRIFRLVDQIFFKKAIYLDNFLIYCIFA